ncbi:MAG: DNA polymerase I [Peptostreptococcus porci]|uniref:DNA polymerase I n=1 Tax=Peptostreptococcus porci TaxID=2652282 RepID=UPI002A75A243|nr:DNA polymerase I [Peptostreptococcus porci]MDY2793844.1 DNA polymerase I [Peptostreptococcus porci]MDY5479612.1 DNA polymerase I [Peptostreptococcus porci]
MDNKKKILLIDGNSIINRAFFALPPMDNGDGLHTNAVYGFLSMMFKMIKNIQPTHISVAFDLKAPTFRHKAFADYKAGRKGMPSELAMQLEPLKNILDSMNIDRKELEGYEADDILGTISRIGEENDFSVYVVTGDKDAIQLASDKTLVMITKKGVAEVEEYNTEGVIERYGLTPAQFIDLKGLMGDKSDNIPGIPGIGEKTGIKLLQEFGSVEGVIENVDKLKGAQKKKVEENTESAIMSKELATIDRNIPLDSSFEDMEFGSFDVQAVIKEFQKLKFNSLISKLSELTDCEEKEVEKKEINKLEDIETFIEKINEEGVLSIKTICREGNILDKNIIKTFLSIDGKEYYYLDGEEIIALKEILESEEIEKIGYELKQDFVALRPYGIYLGNIKFDISIAEYVIESKSSSSYDIDSIANKYLYKKVMTKDEILGKGAKSLSFEEVDFEKLKDYIIGIFDTVFGVIEAMEKSIIDDGMEMLFYDVEMPLIAVLGDMEYTGIMVDKDVLNELDLEIKELISDAEKKIFSLAGEEFNINSPKQLGVILFEKLGLPVVKKTKTGYSTNAEVLEKLMDEHEIIKLISDYRTVVKLKSTYIDGLNSVINEKDGRIHSTFNQTIASTGRISSTDPNLQNIPVRTNIGRNIRKVFISENGRKLVDADYSQVELRVLAHMSGDENMIEAFSSGEDIHRKTASQVFNVSLDDVTPELRSAAKAVNFGIIYGKSDFGLAKDLNISLARAKDYINSYFGKYDKIKGFMDEIVANAERTGYSTTMFNRRRYIPEIKSNNFIDKNRGKRAAMNAPIQGSAADIIKIAMVNVHNRLFEEGLKSKLILQVHDELIVEAVEDELEIIEALLKEEMENAVYLDVDLDVDLNIGNSWYETK